MLAKFFAFLKQRLIPPKFYPQLVRERPIAPSIVLSTMIRGDTAYSIDGDYIRTWKLKGIPFETTDDEILISHKEHLNTLLRSIGSPRVALYTHQVRRETADRLEGVFADDFSRALDTHYYDSLARYRMMTNELYLSLVYRPYPTRPERALARSGRTREVLGQQQANALRDLDELASRLEKGLSAYAPRVLTGYERNGALFSEPLSFWNFLLSGHWQPVRLPRGPLPRHLGEVLGTSALLIGTESLELRGAARSRYARILDCKDYPAWTEPGMLSELLRTAFEYVFTQSFRFYAKQEAMTLLERQERQLANADDAAKSQIDEMAIARDQLASGEFGMGEYHSSLLIFGDDPEELRDDTSEASTLLEEAGFLPALVSLATDAASGTGTPGGRRSRCSRPGAASPTTSTSTRPRTPATSPARRSWGTPGSSARRARARRSCSPSCSRRCRSTATPRPAASPPCSSTRTTAPSSR
jgi:type IV secretory pathway VirB4 component